MTQPLTAKRIAMQAAELVEGDRARTHGDKEAGFANIARLWNAWLRNNKDVVSDLLEPSDVSTLMALLKIARTAAGEYNIDDFIDAAGYIAIAGELSAPKETRR